MPLPTRPEPVLPSLLTAAAVGIAALAVPAWLAYDNPSGIEMVDGVAQYLPDAPGAPVRGHSYVGGWVAADRVHPDRGPRVLVLRLGLTQLCLEDAEAVELRRVRAVPRAGTPEPAVRGMVRRLAPDSVGPDGGTLGAGTTWDPVPQPGERDEDPDMIGTWHALEGAGVTAPCVDGEPDIFVTGGEEVVAAVDVDVRGIDLDHFVLDTLVDGEHHRLVVEADVTVCGTRVSNPYCEEASLDDDA